MRLREITETKQVNELAPLAAIGLGAGVGALTWTVVMAAVDAYFIYDAGREINQILSKYGYDTSKVSDDDWWEISIVVVATGIALAAPALGKWTRAMVSKYMPESIKKKTMELVKSKVIDKFSKEKPPVAKDPNKIERPFSKDADAVSPANSAGKPPKNPNLIDRPYQKEQLLRLAGLAK